MKKIVVYLFSILLLNIFLTSCEEEIKINLNSTNPKIVVQADISTDPGPYYVRINKTVNFDESNSFPIINDANVIISDDAGNSETLINIGDGTYKTNTIQGVLGRTYYLDIIYDGKNYTSTSTIPDDIVPIDSVFTTSANLGRNNEIRIVPVFKDPAGKTNYYKFNYAKNTIAEKRVILLNDLSNDGEINTRALRGTNVANGDTVDIEIQNIDKSTYEYFDGFIGLNGGLNQSATPSNPVSNIKGENVLGYFSAHSSYRKKTIIKL